MVKRHRSDGYHYPYGHCLYAHGLINDSHIFELFEYEVMKEIIVDKKIDDGKDHLAPKFVCIKKNVKYFFHANINRATNPAIAVDQMGMYFAISLILTFPIKTSWMKSNIFTKKQEKEKAVRT